MKGRSAKTTLLFRSARRNMAVRAFQPLAFRAADNERAPLRPGTTTTVTLPTYPVPPAPHVPTNATPPSFPPSIPPPMSTGGRSRMPPTQPGTSWDTSLVLVILVILDIARYIPYRIANIVSFATEQARLSDPSADSKTRGIIFPYDFF